MDFHGSAHSHGNEYAHQVDNDKQSWGETDDDSDHGQHCCHAHASFTAGHLTAMSCNTPNLKVSFNRPHTLNFTQAPPTPPPNV